MNQVIDINLTISRIFFNQSYTSSRTQPDTNCLEIFEILFVLLRIFVEDIAYNKKPKLKILILCKDSIEDNLIFGL